MKLLKWTVILTTCALLSACASMVSPAGQAANDKPISWEARRAELSHISHWQIRGATAISTPKKAFSASLNWRQFSKYGYNLNIFGPLGIGSVELTGRGGKVILKRGSEVYRARSGEALLHQQLGWELPVANLYYWVRGLPAPGAPKQIKFDKYHHIVSLQQQGWRIRYLKYTAVGKYDLPSKIYLQNRYMSARLIISNWQI